MKEEFQKLESYHKHLCANAHLLNQSIQSWEVLYRVAFKDHVPDDVAMSSIRDVQKVYYDRLRESFETINCFFQSDINNMAPGFEITPVMSYDQWYRNKQLEKIL